MNQTEPAAVLASASTIFNHLFLASQRTIDGRDREWCAEASSTIALLAGGAPILYLDTDFRDTGEKRALVVAITEDVLVVIDVEPSKDGPTSITRSRVIGRASLDRLAVWGVSNAVGHQGGYWPQRVRAELGYGDLNLSLPFPASTLEQVADLAALLPSLARDLNR